MTVYSTRLVSVRITPAANWVTVLTVPTGYRNVIKCFSITQLTASGALVALALASSGFELLRAVPDSGSRAVIECTVTLHEGETLLARAYVNQADVHCSGFELTGSGGPDVPGSLPA